MLQKRSDDELNDLVPFQVESLCLLCEESCSPCMGVPGFRKRSNQAWELEEGQTGHSRLKGAWMRLGQKSCDGERLKSSTVVDVLLLCGHLWLPGREGWWLAPAPSTGQMTRKPQQLRVVLTET